MTNKSASFIARQIIARYDVEAGETVSNLQLQKLLYYAQGWHLAFFGKPLFDAQLQAWDHGPVQPFVYREYKHFSWSSITLPLHEAKKEEDPFLDCIKWFYGAIHGKELERQTHKELPWLRTYRNGEMELIIPNSLLTEFFRTGYGDHELHRQFVDYWYRFQYSVEPGSLSTVKLSQKEYSQKLHELGLDLEVAH
ncbi:MAG: hypothetical protein A2600_12900 [Candidatus Lambdaproteobacteria bacterium RIFOXYD1_FULL_56_27]|uniref:Antitoxin SocA-like Panacea domain-containing protein n=1 Tax=Candidatus Lambdaproteobacteria bacterium RIFOXYD2_FULL_56_26 TaxID=1817773 RepID=A0A1F6GP57_9PROT|nr:MAG: hypothetical protein A2557_12135 [Candidatus Lambdaproteobacteria bacterium RIFOXYD2_FULL_56_26]OGH09879.1 MAG: hypothetical protein A2600_12900 [Candidatus Lambdaproteobacteria bacterium RIFOXYD1_FULL_56_27]